MLASLSAEPRNEAGIRIALATGMKTFLPRFCSAALLSASLMVPLAMTPMPFGADDHKDSRNYHDKKHNDDHAWNNHEDQAYRIYAKENHRKYRDFSRLKENDQQAYWGWSHDHSDALLKIEIR